MELDDLKQTWKQSVSRQQKPATDIRALLQSRTQGPIARLSRTFRRRLIILPMALLLLTLNLSRHHDIFSDLLFWLYVVVCVGLTVYFYLSYRLVRQMQQQADGQVREVLLRQASLLEKTVRWRLLAVRLLFVLFIVVLEILMHARQEPSLARWYAHPLPWRLGAYALLALVFYAFTGLAIRYQYGRHIRRLKELVQQME